MVASALLQYKKKSFGEASSFDIDMSLYSPLSYAQYLRDALGMGSATPAKGKTPSEAIKTPQALSCMPEVFNSTRSPGPPKPSARAGEQINATVPLPVAQDQAKQPSQVPLLSPPAPPAADKSVFEELIASTERQHRLDADRHQEFLQQFLQSQQQFQQQQLSSQQLLFQQQQNQQMQFDKFQQQFLQSQQQQQQQMQELTTNFTTTMKSVSEKLSQMESNLMKQDDKDGAVSVNKLPTLDSVIGFSSQHHSCSRSGETGVRVSQAAALQQVTTQ
jgi:hypothetical protein